MESCRWRCSGTHVGTRCPILILKIEEEEERAWEGRVMGMWPMREGGGGEKYEEKKTSF